MKYTFNAENYCFKHVEIVAMGTCRLFGNKKIRPVARQESSPTTVLFLYEAF